MATSGGVPLPCPRAHRLSTAAPVLYRSPARLPPPPPPPPARSSCADKPCADVLHHPIAAVCSCRTSLRRWWPPFPHSPPPPLPLHLPTRPLPCDGAMWRCSRNPFGALTWACSSTTLSCSTPYVRYFHEVDEELLRSLIRVNVEGVTRVTHAVLPSMVDRKRGAIVNIGSGAASVMPSDSLYSVCAASKARVT